MRGLLVLSLGLAGFGGQAMLTPSPVSAAAPVAFDPKVPLAFVAQDRPTSTLYAGQQTPGNLDLRAQGSTANINYNALGYNTGDNFLYAIRGGPTATAPGTNVLLKIGQGGVVESLGAVPGLPTISANNNSYMQGSFGGNSFTENLLYVRDYDTARRLWIINIGTQEAEELVLSAPVAGVADLAWSGDYFWGVSSTTIFRIHPINGDVLSWPIPLPEVRGKTFGASWALGNGNIQLEDNTSGTVFQLRIIAPAAGAPTFELVGKTTGPTSNQNDGASSPGDPVDLGIVKSGPAEYAPGDAITYTMTVTNHGTGGSSGSIVNDGIPVQLENATTTTPGCSIAGATPALTCSLGALAVGASTAIVVNARVKATLVAPLPNITNIATVLGNEADPNPNNNSSTTTAVPHPGTLVLAKTSDPASGTTIVPGQLVQYTLTFTNPGLTPVDVNHVDLLQDVVDDAELEGAIVTHTALTATAVPLNQPTSALHITGTLNGGVTATVTYSVRVKTVLPSHATGKLGNFLMKLGEDPPPVCVPGSTNCTEHPVRASLSWNKVNDRTPAQFLAGSEWTLTPYDRAAVPVLDPSTLISVVDCVAASAAECAGPDSNPAVGKFAVADLTIGKYRLTETKAPAGYLRITPIDIDVFSVLDYGNIVNRQAPVPTLPLTGGMGTAVFWGSTGGLGLLAAVALILQRRRIRFADPARPGA